MATYIGVSPRPAAASAVAVIGGSCVDAGALHHRAVADPDPVAVDAGVQPVAGDGLERVQRRHGEAGGVGVGR